MNFFVQVTEGEDLPQYPNLGEITLEKTKNKAPLIYKNNRLIYLFKDDQGTREISFCFESYFDYWQRVKPVKSKDLLGRALGLKKGDYLLDLCCGTGKDSSLFLYWELKVISFERDPVVYLLLQDGLLRLSNHPSYQRYLNSFELVYGDAKNHLASYPDHTAYYDPMYGNAKKKTKAKSRKEMEFFKGHVGADTDANEFLELLIDSGRRVVLKRPDDAFELELNTKTTCVKWKGKTVDYWRLN